MARMALHLLHLLNCLIAIFSPSPGAPDIELRGAWLATVANIDWPSEPGLPTIDQRDQLLNYVNLLSDLNFNAIFFQIRPVGDAFYDSPLEPWSKYLTGAQGIPPSPIWDPLDFTVQQAHARGMEVHAWLNPYRANMAPNWDGLDDSHMAVRMRQYAYPYGEYLWMDPGAEAVVGHLLDVADDVLTRYDVDGIHMDDYFYPYPAAGMDFPDNQTYSDYTNSGGSLSLADWRRENVNSMIRSIHELTQSHRKIFSVSPFGLYRAGHPEGMPPPITGFDPYREMYADSKLWLQEGWLDWFIPQIYWSIDSPGQSYPLILDWWLQANTKSKLIAAGTAVYKMLDPNDWNPEEIINQADISREESNRERGSLGNVHFSAKYFRDDLKGIVGKFHALYPNEASIPS